MLLQVSLLGQYSDPALRSIGYHTGNRTGISFYNDGQIAGFSVGIDIRGEWPLGSGENYIGDCIPLIGVEFINALNDTLNSVTISRGPRRGQFDEKHPTQNYFWGAPNTITLKSVCNWVPKSVIRVTVTTVTAI